MSEFCPICKVSLQGDPIPQEYIDAGHYGSGATHYSRMIGHEVRGVYDGVLYWSCPDCGMAWQRWCDGGRLTDVSAEYVAEHNANVGVA